MQLLKEKVQQNQSDDQVDWIYGVANFSVQELCKIALDGNEKSARGLLLIIESSLDALDSMCHKNPEFFEAMARKKLYWPAYISNLSENKKRNENLLRILNVGKDSGLNISGKQPDWNAVETEIALMLFRTLKVIGRLRLPEDKNQLFQRTPMPPLTRQNYKEWFNEAWPYYIERHGKDYENKKQFSHYWKNNAYKGKSNARALIRDAIKKKIRQAFRSIAPKSS